MVSLRWLGDLVEAPGFASPPCGGVALVGGQATGGDLSGQLSPRLAVGLRDRAERCLRFVPIPSVVLDEVLTAAAQGQPWALRALYEELAPRVHGYLLARGAHEPEDLTSEVFLAVFARLGTVTGGMAGLRSLTFTVAHARLVDELRRRGRQPVVTDYDPDRDRRSHPSSEDEALQSLSEHDLVDMLSRLPDAQRDVLTLRHLADLSIDQVATVLGRTPGAIKQLQRRGLLALRDVLAAEGVTP